MSENHSMSYTAKARRSHLKYIHGEFEAMWKRFCRVTWEKQLYVKSKNSYDPTLKVFRDKHQNKRDQIGCILGVNLWVSLYISGIFRFSIINIHNLSNFKNPQFLRRKTINIYQSFHLRRKTTDLSLKFSEP